MELPALRTNHNRNVVCVFARGPKVTHYLGVDGELVVKQMPNIEFEREYYRDLLDKTPLDFVHAYTRDESARRMIPISGSAMRVLRGILTGQPHSGAVSSTQLENVIMATAAPEFRKPDGPVAQIHAFLDKKVDGIKAGTVSRKELVDALTEKGYSLGTITTQAGVWARTNGIKFVRPTQAKENKTNKRKASAKKAAKASN